MKQIRFKDKGREGQILGLGKVTNDWREVSDNDLAYFDHLNTRLAAPDKQGNRKVLSRKTLDDYGIEVKGTSTKKEDDK